MDFLNKINWYIKANPKTAINNETFKDLTENEFNTVVFATDIKLSLVLNNNYDFTINRDIKGPITVLNLLTFIYDFYQEKLRNIK